MSKPKVVACSCGERFSSTSAMAMHIKAKHKGQQPQPSQPVAKPGWLKRLWRWIFRPSKKS